MNSKIERLMIQSFDQPLGVEEKQFVEQTVQQSAVAQQFQEDHQYVSQLLAEQKQTATIPFFAAKVIHKIKALSITTKQETLFDVLATFLPKVTLSGFALLIILLISTYYIEGSLSIDNILGIQDLTTITGTTSSDIWLFISP